MKPILPTTNLNSKNPSQSQDDSAQITSPPSYLAPNSPPPVEESLSNMPSSYPMIEASSVTSVVVETTYSTPRTEAPYIEATTDTDTPINDDTTPPTQSPLRTDTVSPTRCSPNSMSSSTALRSLSILSINKMIMTLCILFERS